MKQTIKTLLLISNGVVVKIIEHDTLTPITPELVGIAFDTVVDVAGTTYVVGEDYTDAGYQLKLYNLLPMEEQKEYDRKKMVATVEQVEIALLLEGYLTSTESVISTSGSARLKYGWSNKALKYHRNCNENLELISLLGIPPEVSDSVFTLAMSVNPKDYESTLNVQDALTVAKYYASKKINAIFNVKTTNIIYNIPTMECLSWAKQEGEARAWLLNNGTVTPMIDGLLVTRNNGETKLELINKIIDNADAYTTAYASLLGFKQYYIKQIEVSTIISEVKDIQWV